MPVAFYMDQHVPLAITEGLIRLGVDVIRTQDDGRDRATDDEILDRAAELGRVVFTRDEDFLALAHERQAEDVPFAGVAYAHQQGASVGDCVRDLALIAAACEPKELENSVLYLPL